MDLIISETAGQRIQVLARPIVSPGKCAICGHVGTNETGDRSPVYFIDIGLDVDYYGRVYLCTTCVVQMGNVLGFTSPVETENHRTRLQEQESELIVLREQNERLRASLVNLLGVANDSSVPILLDGSKDEQSGEPSVETSPSDGAGKKSSSDKSSSSKGPVGISGLADNIGGLQL